MNLPFSSLLYRLPLCFSKLTFWVLTWLWLDLMHSWLILLIYILYYPVLLVVWPRYCSIICGIIEIIPVGLLTGRFSDWFLMLIVPISADCWKSLCFLIVFLTLMAIDWLISFVLDNKYIKAERGLQAESGESIASSETANATDGCCSCVQLKTQEFCWWV